MKISDRIANARHVGGGVKVVEKWRFEIPKDSWHDFRWPSVFTPCPDVRRPVLGALVKKTKKGFDESLEENAAYHAGISNRQNCPTFDLTLTRQALTDASTNARVIKGQVLQGGSADLSSHDIHEANETINKAEKELLHAVEEASAELDASTPQIVDRALQTMRGVLAPFFEEGVVNLDAVVVQTKVVRAAMAVSYARVSLAKQGQSFVAEDAQRVLEVATDSEGLLAEIERLEAAAKRARHRLVGQRTGENFLSDPETIMATSKTNPRRRDRVTSTKATTNRSQGEDVEQVGMDSLYRLPTMDIKTARGILDIPEDDILQLIDRGLFWVWNIASPGAKRRMLRLLTKSVGALSQEQAATLLKDQFSLATRAPATKEEAIDAVLIGVSTEKPYITAQEIKRLLNFSGTHMSDILASKALPELSGTHQRPGPNGQALIPRDAFKQFLNDRLLC